MDIYDERREEFYEENMFGECEKTLEKIKKRTSVQYSIFSRKKDFLYI